jgi:hypothetical protein
MVDLLRRLNEVQDVANAGNLRQAETECREIIAAAPAMPEATAVLGFIVARLERFDEARALLEDAISRRNDVPHWHLELRTLHRRAHRLDAALAAAREAVRLAQGDAKFLVGLAVIHVDRGENEAARAILLDALTVAPEDVEAHLALGHLLLAEGEYRAGWDEYEWRFRQPLFQKAWPRFPRPRWNGMRLRGRLLVAAEQGFGDAFQFSRYLPMAAERCGGVVVLCRQPQIPIFSRIDGVQSCVVSVNDTGPYAAWCGIASLPRLFCTEVTSIPRAHAYLSPDPRRRVFWRDALARRLPGLGLRVGLVWSGNKENATDWRRSVPLALFEGIEGVNGIEVVSLQQEIADADRVLASRLRLFDLGAELTDFGETAAVLANLDLVITVDSAVAHLSAALGVPTWVLIYQPADWRWMTGRDDNPWYPSVRLFRQTSAGDWADPVSRLIAALAELV